MLFVIDSCFGHLCVLLVLQVEVGSFFGGTPVSFIPLSLVCLFEWVLMWDYFGNSACYDS